ncbi:MAG TPA: hypothetical protein PLE10_03725 [Brevefilum sp.]|nr:hypothetical protein [Brevefilum sp.]HOR18923.1 hypothetical protein [Brevefilum sp.]HPL69996.1 hypothetical protein [Brevefilum sp.]
MNKKTYAAPQVKKVKLEIKNAILAVCNQSPSVMDPKDGPVPCSITNCYGYTQQ